MRVAFTLELTAVLTSAAVLSSTSAVNLFTAKEVGHMSPSSRFAAGTKPNVAYLDLSLCALWKKQNDLAVLGVSGHPVPGSRREGWRARFDDGVEPLGHNTIRFRHLGDLREHVAFPVRLLRPGGVERTPGGPQLLP